MIAKIIQLVLGASLSILYDLALCKAKIIINKIMNRKTRL